MTSPIQGQGVTDESMALPVATPRAEPDQATGELAPCVPHASAEEELSQFPSGAALAAAKEAHSSLSLYSGNYNVAIFAALTTGATVGIVLRGLSTKPWPARHVMYLAFPGELLRRMLREAALPLCASSVIAATGSMQRPLSLRVACFSLFYAVVVKLASQGNAVLTTLAVQPGRVFEAGELQRLLDAVPPHARLYEHPWNGTATDVLYDIARTLLPDNIVETFLYTDIDELVPFPNKTGVHVAPSSRLVAHQASLLLFCAMLGVVLSTHGGSGTLLGFFIGLSNAMMFLAHFILLYAPFGLFFATAAFVVQTRNLQPLASHLALYLFTVGLSLVVHALVVLPFVLATATGRSFRGLLQNAATPLAVAFGAASSSETVPPAIAALEESLNLDTRIVRLLVPIAAVLNTDGTSIYITISALFFAQTKTDYVDLRTVLLVCALSVLCSMAAPTTGGPSYLRVRLIHEAVGMPTDTIGILFITDWIVSRLATVVDVLTGLVSVYVVQHYCGLEEQPTMEDANRDIPPE
ncbi:excitatory amino acid transporter-like isoform X2 [Dermacentor albipictus]